MALSKKMKMIKSINLGFSWRNFKNAVFQFAYNIYEKCMSC